MHQDKERPRHQALAIWGLAVLLGGPMVIAVVFSCAPMLARHPAPVAAAVNPDTAATGPQATDQPDASAISEPWVSKMRSAMSCVGVSKDAVVSTMGAPDFTRGNGYTGGPGYLMGYAYRVGAPSDQSDFVEDVFADTGHGLSASFARAEFSGYAGGVAKPNAGDAWQSIGGDGEPDRVRTNTVTAYDVVDGRTNMIDTTRFPTAVIFTMPGGRWCLMAGTSPRCPLIADRRFDPAKDGFVDGDLQVSADFDWREMTVDRIVVGNGSHPCDPFCDQPLYTDAEFQIPR